MSEIKKFKDHGWAAAGSICGIIAGSAANFLKSRSFLETDSNACKNIFNGFSLFSYINELRERDVRVMSESFFYPTLFSCLYPTAHVVPMLGYSIYNIYTKKPSDEQGIKSFAKRGWIQISKNVIYPSLNTALLVLSVVIARGAILKKFIPERLDISGHAIIQVGLTIHAINSLQSISETGTANQKKIHSIICALISISDAIWMYNTTASCHSIADVISGAALTSLAYFGMQATKELINKKFNLGWSQCSPCTTKNTQSKGPIRFFPSPQNSKVNSSFCRFLNFCGSVL